MTIVLGEERAVTLATLHITRCQRQLEGMARLFIEWPLRGLRIGP